MYDYSGLEEALAELGIKTGDTVYVASDITLLLTTAAKEQGVTAGERYEYLNGFVDLLQKVVGEKGTLLFPVFSWEFCRGNGFDVRYTMGEVGTLNNWILKSRRDFTRTQNPMYSFMVWGKDTKIYTEMENTDCWGQNSPFAYLHHHGGKMLLFNVSLQRGFTFFHYIERQLKVPYRYLKSFKGNYINADGDQNYCMYMMYVRDLDIKSEEYLPDEMLEEPGVMKATKWKEETLKVVNLAASYDVISDDLKNNGGQKCYHFENYTLDWSKGQTHPNQI